MKKGPQREGNRERVNLNLKRPLKNAGNAARQQEKLVRLSQAGTNNRNNHNHERGDMSSKFPVFALRPMIRRTRRCLGTRSDNVWVGLAEAEAATLDQIENAFGASICVNIASILELEPLLNKNFPLLQVRTTTSVSSFALK